LTEKDAKQATEVVFPGRNRSTIHARARAYLAWQSLVYKIHRIGYPSAVPVGCASFHQAVPVKRKEV